MSESTRLQQGIATEPLVPDTGATLQLSTLGLLEIIARHFRTLVVVPLGVAAVAVLYVVIAGRTYRADSSFTPEASGGAMQRVAGLAAQFGVSLGGNNPSESVDFYSELIRSRSILEQVAKQRYVYRPAGLFAGHDSVVGTLVEVYHSGGRNELERLNGAIHTVSANLAVKPAPRSNIVRVSVIAPSVELAERINANLLQAVSDFNVAKRQTRAAAERSFVAERLRLAQAEQQSAESALEGFLRSNRRYQDAPQLNVEFGRLQRRVELRQQVANTLAQAFEQSRIEEVRNTPVITVIERPEGAAVPERTLRKAAVLGGLVGGFFTLVTVLLIELLRSQQALDPGGYARLLERVRRIGPGRRSREAAV